MGDNSEKVPLKALLMLVIFIILIPLSPMIISGRWDWLEAWLYFIVTTVGFAVSRWLASRKHADLLKERSHYLDQPDAVSWDKLLSPLVGLGGALIPITAGVEALLDGSTLFSIVVKIIALILIIAGYAIGSYALIANRFFSGMVRIQTERGHQLVTGGPYRWVRHPGYAGALLTYFATPLFLDSPWTFVPVLLLALVLIIRTSKEDKFLQEKLDGYREYAGRVRYRLVPGLW